MPREPLPQHVEYLALALPEPREAWLLPLPALPGPANAAYVQLPRRRSWYARACRGRACWGLAAAVAQRQRARHTPRWRPRPRWPGGRRVRHACFGMRTNMSPCALSLWHAAQDNFGLRLQEFVGSSSYARLTQARPLASTLRTEVPHPAVLAASHAARSCASSRASSAANCASSASLRASSAFRPAASGAPAAAAAGPAARSTLSRYARRSSALVLPSKKPPVMVRSASLDSQGAAAGR